jgi:cob(I)alamin adenosyltransferase
MKIYTKTGDDGSTGLFGGERVGKSDPRIECTGALDELNAALGWAEVANPAISMQLREIQSDIFSLGAAIATPNSPAPANVNQADIDRLEKQIDAVESQLQPLRNFILPGGCEGSARLHLARTACRRAERVLVAFSAIQPPPPLALIYVNRLSDLLFVQARRANQLTGVTDIPWTV